MQGLKQQRCMDNFHQKVLLQVILYCFRIALVLEMVSYHNLFEKHLCLGKRAANAKGNVPDFWFRIGQLITKCIDTSYPKMTKGPFRGRPHPAPSVDLLPQPLKDWYIAQGDSGKGDSWLTDIQGRKFARLPSLFWKGGLALRFQYLVVVGEGARGTAERSAPIAVRALSVFTAGAQLQRTLDVRVPPIPFAPEIPSYLEAVAASLTEEAR